MKVSEIRARYSIAAGGILTEEDIFRLAQSSKEYQLTDKIKWMQDWNVSWLRPYDEWNIDLVQFEIRTLDSDGYTVTKTKKNGSTIIKKGKPEKLDENQQYLEEKKWNIYEGVYCPVTQTMIKWGIKKNMIRPQDPKEIGNAEFSYSFYMPQNYVMRNLAIPEKIEAAVDGMIHACLKIQQDVSMAIPPGWVIDETAWQGMDYGLGDEGNKAVDQAKLFFQTGKVFYKGLDAEGNRVPVPVQEIANTGFQQHIEAFARTYQFWYQSLKDELGEDPNLMSQALQPRVTAGNVEASQLQAEYATDYIYRAYSECMKITARKVSCLLKDSIQYGAKAYRDIVKEEDISGRIFTTDIRFLPTEQDIMRFEEMMNQAMMATPELNLFVNPFQLMQMAKEDVKLAWLYFNQGQKKMLLWQKQTAAENQQATIEGQIKSAQAAEEAKQATESLKGEIEIKKSTITAEAQNRTSVINMVTSWLAPKADGTVGTVPPKYEPLVDAVVQNIMISAISATEEQKQQIIAKMQQAEMEQQEEQMESEQGEGQEQMQSPQQPQVAA